MNVGNTWYCIRKPCIHAEGIPEVVATDRPLKCIHHHSIDASTLAAPTKNSNRCGAAAMDCQRTIIEGDVVTGSRIAALKLLGRCHLGAWDALASMIWIKFDRLGPRPGLT